MSTALQTVPGHAVCPLFFESVSKMERRCNLAGGECESANKMEWMMMRSQLLLISFNLGMKTVTGLKPL